MITRLIFVAGVLHGAYSTYKVLKREDELNQLRAAGKRRRGISKLRARKEELLQWWVVVVVYHLLGDWAYLVFGSLVPFYATLEALMCVWIMLPNKHGARCLFQLIVPKLDQYAKEARRLTRTTRRHAGSWLSAGLRAVLLGAARLIVRIVSEKELKHIENMCGQVVCVAETERERRRNNAAPSCPPSPVPVEAAPEPQSPAVDRPSSPEPQPSSPEPVDSADEDYVPSDCEDEDCENYDIIPTTREEADKQHSSLSRLVFDSPPPPSRSSDDSNLSFDIDDIIARIDKRASPGLKRTLRRSQHSSPLQPLT